MKTIPQRMCVVTRQKTNKTDLLRIVRTPEGNVVVDLTGKANGKGAYITKSLEVIEKAKKSKALDRALEVTVDDSVYEEIKKYL